MEKIRPQIFIKILRFFR